MCLCEKKLLLHLANQDSSSSVGYIFIISKTSVLPQVKGVDQHVDGEMKQVNLNKYKIQYRCI